MVARRNWQIVCGLPDEVEPEDVPEQVATSLPGIRYLTELVLEPLHAPESAKKEILAAARLIAKSSHGVVLDRQTDELTTPKGVKRFVPEVRSERFALLELDWWFQGDRIFTAEAMGRLLNIFATALPEALPKRYGSYEPPQHKLAEMGMDHLSNFLLENLDESLVLYPHRPFMGLTFSCTKEAQHPRLGFRCHRISLECEASAISQPGWQEGLRRLWLQVCRELKPFYSEVRTLNGYERIGATYGSDMKTEVHPIYSWFWRGIPRKLGHAIAVGNPYLNLWPEVVSKGQSHGEFVSLDAGEWTAGKDLTIQAPEGICQKWTPAYEKTKFGWSINWVKEYPETWPFERV